VPGPVADADIAVLGFTIASGKAVEIDILADPERLTDRSCRSTCVRTKRGVTNGVTEVLEFLRDRIAYTSDCGEAISR
jgi:hypothetical protein